MTLAMRVHVHISDHAVMVGIAVSVVLHLIALFVFSPARQGPASSAGDLVLHARLMPRSAIRERPPSPEPEQVRPEPVRPEPPRRVETPSVTRPPVPVVAQPAAPRIASAPPAATPPVAPPSTPAAPATPPVAASQPAQPASAAASVPPSATAGRPGGQEVASIDSNRASTSADEGSIQQFRQNILIATRRYKRYPAQAMEKGWQGRVVIHLVIGSNGLTQSYAVKSSSGFQMLDETALDMVKKGRPLVQVPVALRGQQFEVDVPVIFDLREG